MEKISAQNKASKQISSSPSYSVSDGIRNQNDFSFKSLLLSRIFMLVAVTMLSLTIMLSLSLLQLLPEINIDTALVIKVNQSTDVVNIEPYDREMASNEEIMETFVRKYVEARHSITTDEVEQKRYWSPGGVVWFLSTPSIYERFSATLKPYWEAVKLGSLTREVEIMGVQHQGRTAFWAVDFKINDIDTKTLVTTTRYRTANIGCRFEKSNVRYTRRMINPLGFRVFEYNSTDVQVGID
jgi:type IV secretory pathway component VirB8